MAVLCGAPCQHPLPEACTDEDAGKEEEGEGEAGFKGRSREAATICENPRVSLGRTSIRSEVDFVPVILMHERILLGIR